MAEARDLPGWPQDRPSGFSGRDVADTTHVIDQLNAEDHFSEEYPDLDEPWDTIVAQQELEDFEQEDEYFGYFGGDEDW